MKKVVLTISFIFTVWVLYSQQPNQTDTSNVTRQDQDVQNSQQSDSSVVATTQKPENKKENKAKELDSLLQVMDTLGYVKVKDTFYYFNKSTNSIYICKLLKAKVQFEGKAIKSMEITYVPLKILVKQDTGLGKIIGKIFNLFEAIIPSFGYPIDLNESFSDLHEEIDKINFEDKKLVYLIDNEKKSLGQDTIKIVSSRPIPIKTQRQKNNIGKYYFSVKKYNLYNNVDYSGIITLDEILDFDFLFDDAFDNAPTDTFLVLLPNKKYTLLKEPINKIFDFKIYTDYRGLFGNQPDGILQTELNTHFILNVAPIGYNISRRGFVPLNYANPYIYYAKFNEKYAAIPLIKQDDTLRLNSLQINRYSFLKSGLDLNLMTYSWPGLSSKFTFDLFAEASITKGIDTITSSRFIDTIYVVEKNTQTIDLVSGRSGLLFNWQIKPYSKLWVDLGGKVYLSYVLNKPYPSTLEYDIFPNNTAISKFFYRDQNINYIWYIEFTLVQNKHKYFFRSVYNGALNNALRYYNFQFGYSINFSDVINANKKLFKTSK